MRLIIPIFAVLFTLSCVDMAQIHRDMAKMYNVAETHTSKLDGLTTYTVSNILCAGGIVFDLSQTDQQPVLFAGIAGINNVADGESLLLNIDGSLYTLSTHDGLTRHKTRVYQHGVTSQASQKAYPITQEMIKRIATAKNVVARVRHLQTYTEAECTTDTSLTQQYIAQGLTPPQPEYLISTQRGFQKFLQLTQQTKK